MKLRTKRLLLSLFAGTIIYIDIVFWLSIDTEISFRTLTPNLIVVLCVTFLLWIFLLYLTSSWRKSEDYLRKVEKWDSPKRIGLMIIFLWVVFAVFYNIKPYKWLLFYAIAISITYIFGANMRNLYRK